jgi:hypothetical protein
MTRKSKNPHMGSTLESFLEEEGIYEAATLKATKAVIAWQIAQVMKEEGLNKTTMAKRMATSRAQLDRLLDPSLDVTMEMVVRAAAVLRRRLVLELR